MDAKRQLSDILDFLKYKLDNNLCTMEEMESVCKAIEQNMEINGEIKDFAAFYDKPEVYVRGEIQRKMVSKPKRRVLYPFAEFARNIPKSWKKKYKAKGSAPEP